MATLKELVSETTRIKDTLKNCQNNLKNNLTTKGVKVPERENISNMIDMVLDIKGSKIPEWYEDTLKGTYIRCVDLLDSELKSWLSDSHINLKIKDGKVYFLFFSKGESRYYYYDISKNEFVTMESPAPLPNENVEYSYSSIYFNDTVYISDIGIKGGGYATSNNHYMYDMTEDKWYQKTDVPTNFIQYTDRVLHGNKIYLIRSGNGAYTTCYDPETDTFTTKCPPLSSNLDDFGVMGNNIYATNHYDFIVYNTVLDTWTRKAYFPNSDVLSCDLLEIDSKLNSVFNSVLSNYVETPTIFKFEYDDNTNSWSTKHEKEAIGHGACVIEDDCELYLNRALKVESTGQICYGTNFYKIK